MPKMFTNWHSAEPQLRIAVLHFALAYWPTTRIAELVELRYAIYLCPFIMIFDRHDFASKVDIRWQCNITAPSCCGGICTNLNTNSFNCGACNTTVCDHPRFESVFLSLTLYPVPGFNTELLCWKMYNAYHWLQKLWHMWHSSMYHIQKRVLRRSNHGEVPGIITNMLRRCLCQLE